MAKRFKLRTLLIWTVALLAVAAVAITLRPQPVPVDTASVVQGPLEVTVDEEGETRVRDRFVLSAPLAGRVLRIELEPGDAVTAGETVVATFQPSAPVLLDARTRAELRATVRAAEAGLGRARAERQQAEAELEHARAEEARYTKLADEEIVSRERSDNAALAARTRDEALRAATFAVANAEQELQAARARLLQQDGPATGSTEPIVLRAPIDGVVLRRLRESEAVVPAGEPLLELGDPLDLEIVADFLSTDAVKIRTGQAVWIEQWGGDDALRGTVRRVEPSGFTKISALGVEEQRVNVVIDFADAPDDRQALGDGYRVEVRVVVWSQDDVVKVPTGALFRVTGEDGDDRWATFVADDDGTAGLRTLELGPRNGLEASVLDGLAAGDTVIVHPSDKVADGVDVTARDKSEG